jgi:signal transduction histidine kinase
MSVRSYQYPCLIFLMGIFFARGQGTEVALKEINGLLRTNPDSVIKLLPPFFANENDSIKGTAYLYMGNAWYFKSNYDSAIKYFMISAELFLSYRDDISLSKAYNGLGLGHYFLSDYEKSFEFHKKALEARERNGDPQITSTYNNLGLVLDALGSNNEALRYYQKALKAKIEYKQFNTLSTTLTNIGNIFQENHQPDSAILYELKNLRHLDSIPDYRNLATCYNNLSLSYMQKLDYANGERYLLKALALEKKLQRGFEITNVCHNLAKIYINTNKLNKADAYLDSAFILVKNIKDYRPIRTIYRLQAKIDSLRGNLSAAYLHLSDFVDAQSRFDQIEKADLVLDLEKKYQAELKEQQITELQQVNTIKDLEAASARQRQIFMVVGLVLLIASVVILYNRYQLKQRTAKALDEKNSELQKLNGFKDKMFAVISHDLRNPVDAFNTIMESLNQNLQHASREELKEFLESTLQSAKDLKGLLNNLLEWSMVQIGKLPFNPGPILVSDVVRDCASHTETMSVSKGISIVNQIADDASVMIDRSMITIVLRNLLSNAIKFSSEGKSITLSAERSNGSVRISVTDQGIGMTPEEVNKLFKMEESTRSIGNSTEKGAGIGLLLCKELVERNQGKISVESTPGVGSTFSISLPSA